MAQDSEDPMTDVLRVMQSVVQKVDGMASEVRTNTFKLDGFENRLDGLDSKLDNIESGLRELSSKVSTLSGQFDGVGVMAIRR